MSFDAITWAIDQQLMVNEKMVLTILANHLNGITSQCNPSLNTLATECGMNRRTVIRSINTLELRGLIKTVRQKIDGVNQQNQYILNISDTAKNHVNSKKTVGTDSHQGSDCESLGVVTDSHQGSDCESPKPGIEPISLSSLGTAEKLAFTWAQSEPFWADRIKGDIAKFRHYYANGKLREQFEQWQAKQTKGQTNESGKRSKTDSGSSRKLSAVERVRQACGIAEEFENQSVVSHQ